MVGLSGEGSVENESPQSSVDFSRGVLEAVVLMFRVEACLLPPLLPPSCVAVALGRGYPPKGRVIQVMLPYDPCYASPIVDITR